MNCIYLINLSRLRRFLICDSINRFCMVALYFEWRLRMRLAMAKNLFVYANMSKVIAGNKRAGVLNEISIMQSNDCC